MTTFDHALRERPQLGCGVFYPAAGIIEKLRADWDWFWVDGQHGLLDYRDILAAVRACDLVGRPSIVRVAGHDPGEISKVLDTGATGVMVPMTENAAQARQLVDAAKFHPLGKRSYGARRLIDRHGRGYAAAAALAPLLVCQIENEAGLENATVIAAVEGVDVLFFGPDDLALVRGAGMDQVQPEGFFDRELETIAQAAAKHGKLCGSVFPNPTALARAVQLGYRLIVGATDSGLLATGSRDTAAQLRRSLSQGAVGNAPASGQGY